MRPRASSLQARAVRRVANSRRRATQCGFFANRCPTARTVKWSSAMSDATMRASSSAVTVRGGALATNMSRLWSMAESGRSTIAGMVRRPASRQRSKHLKPSRIS